MNTLGHQPVGLTGIRKHRQNLKCRVHVPTLASDLLIARRDSRSPLRRACMILESVFFPVNQDWNISSMFLEQMLPRHVADLVKCIHSRQKMLGKDNPRV